MGQKVNPHGFRVGVIKDWDSRWFADKSDFGDTLVEDYNVRKFLKKNLYAAGVPKIEIERYADQGSNPHSLCKAGCCYRQRAALKSKSCVHSWKRC